MAPPADAGLGGSYAQAESRMQAETFAAALLSRQGTMLLKDVESEFFSR